MQPAERSAVPVACNTPHGRRMYLAFAVALLGTTFGGLTQTAVNTSLPAIMADLGTSVGLSQWLFTIFAFTLGITIPLITFLVGRFPIRRLYLVALSMFTVGSALCYVAPNFPLLLAGRVLQAGATGIMLPLIQLVALTSFSPEHRGLAMGIVGLTMGFAPNVGPTIAGALTTAFGWRSCFLFLASFGAIILVLAVFFMHLNEVHGTSSTTHLDVWSVVLSTLGFGGLLAGFSDAADFGMTSPSCWIPLTVGAVAIVVFVWRQRHVANPIMDMAVFKVRAFTVGTLIIVFVFGAFIGVTLVIPLYIQQVLGHSAYESGLTLLPSVISALIASPLAGAAMDRVGVRPVVMVSSAVLILGTVMLVRLGDMTSLTTIAIWQMVRTFGITALIMPVTTASLVVLPPRLLAHGTSVTNTLRQVAAALSSAVMVLIMTYGDVNAQISSSGVNNAMLLSLLLACGVFLLCLTFNTSRYGKRSNP